MVAATEPQVEVSGQREERIHSSKQPRIAWSSRARCIAADQLSYISQSRISELDKSHSVSLGVADERLPLLLPHRAERVRGVSEDPVRCRENLHVTDSRDSRFQGVDTEIEERRRRFPLKKQPDAGEIKEHKPWGIKGRHRGRTDQRGVEGNCALKVFDALRHLHEG